MGRTGRTIRRADIGCEMGIDSDSTQKAGLITFRESCPVSSVSKLRADVFSYRFSCIRKRVSEVSFRGVPENARVDETMARICMRLTSQAQRPSPRETTIEIKP